MALSDMNFQPGMDFQRVVHDRFGPSASVSSPSPMGEFFLVVSFGRSDIRLDNDSVALMLQSVLGGCAPEFRVQHQSSWISAFLFRPSKLES